MAKINCIQCDICGEFIGSRDAQYLLKLPRKARLYYGYPALGMNRYDVCEDCMDKIIVGIQMKMNGVKIDG